jgi:hypothetical protein
MPNFSRMVVGKQNNRSQQALVEPAAGGGSGGAPASAASSASGLPPPPVPANTVTSHSASSSTAFSSNESFDSRTAQQQQQQQQQPPPPPPHIYNTGGGNQQQLHNQLAGASPVGYDPRQKQQVTDFADPVSRSQSQRYPTVSPIQTQPQYSLASNSADDLVTTLNIASPGQNQGPLPPPVQHQQPVPEPKKSTRRLFKNILTGASRDHHQTREPPPSAAQHVPQNSYDNTGGLARRPSKRVSNPPSIRPGISQLSQISLDQQPIDWQSQGLHTQPSPLQGVGEIDEHHFEQDSNRSLQLQNPQDPPLTTIRRVPTDQDSSPYSPEDLAYQQQQAHAQLQGSQEQLRYNQVAFDHPQQQQQQQQQPQQQYPFGQPQHGQYQAGPPQIFTQHLGNPQHANPETVSQFSHESPITDPDQRSTNFQSAQTSPAVNYAVQTHDNPLPPIPPPAHQNTPQAQQQQMAPPPGGPPPNRRSQETEKVMRGQAEAPPGPPPGYRHSQPPINQMNPLPPPPPAGGSQNPNYRSSNVPERQPQYENSGVAEGRNSPQPSNSERDGTDPDKQFKDLCTLSTREGWKDMLLIQFHSGQVQERQTSVFRRQDSDRTTNKSS